MWRDHGYSNCGRGYYSRYYSPWGYDLFGWRMFSRPFVVVRGGPTIIRRNINIHRGPNIRRDRDWDDNNDWQRGRATRSGYTNGNPSDRTRSTPQRTSTQQDRSRASTNGNSGSWTNRSRGESSGNTSRTQRTSSGTNSGSSTRTRVSSGSSSNSNSNSGSSRATSGGYQSSSGSRGTAKARTNKNRSRGDAQNCVSRGDAKCAETDASWLAEADWSLNHFRFCIERIQESILSDRRLVIR